MTGQERTDADASVRRLVADGVEGVENSVVVSGRRAKTGCSS